MIVLYFLFKGILVRLVVKVGRGDVVGIGVRFFFRGWRRRIVVRGYFLNYSLALILLIFGVSFNLLRFGLRSYREIENFYLFFFSIVCF